MKFKTIFICFFLFSCSDEASDFKPYSISCATQRMLETGRMYGYSDEYIMREWMKSSPYLFDGEHVYFKGFVSGWNKLKMIEQNNKIYWNKYSDALEANGSYVFNPRTMKLTTLYDGKESTSGPEACIKNTWNKGIELAERVEVRK